MYDKVFLLSDQANNYLGSDGYLEQGDHLWMSSAIMSDAEFMVSAYLSGSFHALNQDGWLKSVFINTILERDKRPDVSISDDPEYWLKKLQDFSHADPEAIPITHEIETVLYNCLDYLRMHGDGTELSTIWDRLQTPADECECDEFIFIHDMMKEVMDDVEGN